MTIRSMSGIAVAVTVVAGCGNEGTASTKVRGDTARADIASVGGHGPTGDGTGGGGPTGGGTGGGGPTLSCADLREQINARRNDALACCPTCSNQCQHVVQDVCCKVTVNGPSDELTELVEDYQERCTATCSEPADCHSTVVGVCDPATSRCQQN